MSLDDREFAWFRNERELIILQIKEVKSLLWLVFFLLFTWTFWVSIDVRLRMKQEVDRLVELRRLDAQIVERKEADPR